MYWQTHPVASGWYKIHQQAIQRIDINVSLGELYLKKEFHLIIVCSTINLNRKLNRREFGLFPDGTDTYMAMYTYY
ncbi:hypothetical protein KDK_34550 [Dictyobacter kobayashii]|uniref:Uncharacterized protein n=1 Tax=Dictyobacter kobayashii TaxID=2014872 RepID=A0A402AKV0_9CHLR|nr:hypothetical protein KDK_34550 [Dictyobacter kobayashii]